MSVKCRVAIIGGYGGMGRIFAKLFKLEGCSVVLAGPTRSKGIEASKQLGVEYTKNNVEAVKDADVVIITVPINVTADTIREVAPAVKSGSLIMDLTSVKEWPCELMMQYSKDDVEVLGTHPVFGPRVGSIEGQVFVLTPVKSGKWTKWLNEILVKHKAKLIESSPKEHDEVMAVVQGLTHFTYISVGKTLKELGFDLKRSRQFSSPVYELMLDMVGRIIGQNPHLYAEIQMQNPKVLMVHDAFMKSASELSQTVKEKNENDFVSVMAEAAKHFDDTERAMGRSDKAIASLVSELKVLKESIGEEICLKHIYSGVIHLGVVESVTPDEVVLADGGKTSRLKLSNLQVLDDVEKLEYKKSKYGITSRDYSVVYNESVDEGFICDMLKKDADSVTSVEVKDIYTGGKIGVGRKSVCFSVDLLKDDVKSNEVKVTDFFIKLGGKLR